MEVDDEESPWSDLRVSAAAIWMAMAPFAFHRSSSIESISGTFLIGDAIAAANVRLG